MTCAAVGDMGEVARRVRALEKHWRPEQVDNLRKLLEEANGPHARQAEAMEAHRAAADVLAQLHPDGTRQGQGRWREEQAGVTRTRSVLVGLRAEEAALLSALEVELWWARRRHFEGAVALEGTSDC